MDCGMRNAECGTRNAERGMRISDFETGNPPEGWESEGQFRIAELSEGEFEICERGLLVKSGDIVGFAKGLKYLLGHPEEGREMGRR